MGRPLTKETLNLLRPTAVTVDGGTELPATIIRQESSTRFTVTTADGTAICALTSNNPQPGQMRLAAYAADESSYYVTHISKELVTVVPGTGSALSEGDVVRWNLNTGNSQDLVLDNDTYWSWLSVLDALSLYNWHIDPAGTTYLYGYALDGGGVGVLKISPTGEKIWSTVLQGVVDPYFGFGGVKDNEGNIYVTNSSGDNDNTYISKISSNGELVWQKKFQAATGYDAAPYIFSIDSENSLIVSLITDAAPQVFKFDRNGNVTYQKEFLHPGYDGYPATSYVLDDDSVLFSQVLYIAGVETFCDLIRLDKNGNEISKIRLQDSQDLFRRAYINEIVTDSQGNMVFVGTGANGDYTTMYTTVVKMSLDSEIIWQRGYGNGANFNDSRNILIDNDNCVYAFSYLNIDSSTLITKWDTAGNLIWQRKITNADNSLFWYKQQIHNNHLYVYFYNNAGDQSILRFGLDGPVIGSYTEPFEYIVSDPADDGFGIVSSNLIVATANVTIQSTNVDVTISDLTQENIIINYQFGFNN